MGSMFLCTIPNMVVPSFRNVDTWRIDAVSETWGHRFTIAINFDDKKKEKEDVLETKKFIAWFLERGWFNVFVYGNHSFQMVHPYMLHGV